jgi:hypothetical protein
MSSFKAKIDVDRVEQDSADIERKQIDNAPHYSREEERKAVRKLDWCLMPLYAL